VQSREDEYRSLVTPERVSSEYNEDSIFDLLLTSLAEELGGVAFL